MTRLPANVPPTLFHFTSERYGLEAIRSRSVKVAKITELNDPFEFVGPITEPFSSRFYMKRWKEEIAGEYGIVCLSAMWTHPLLWAHYADSHRGLCLAFDVDQTEEFLPVEYVDRRPTWEEFGYPGFNSLDEDGYARLVHLKFDAWAYENEWRTFVEFNQCTVKDGRHFMPFQPRMKLSKVIMGSRSTSTRSEVRDHLADLASTVEIFKSRPGFKTFEVVRNQSEGSWV